ncbi:MAG: hypothetical protein QOF58_5654 [Pseudonocardiales bacterium]|jgi:hypothetical protein|nr:hypothetical protein [Pseudonocardiales bacterium]
MQAELLTVALAAVLAIPVTGGLAAWLGFVAGRRSRPVTAIVTPYSCACGHPLGMHDKDTGHCHGKDQHKDVYNAQGHNIGSQFLPCECRRYVGEFPVHEIDWSAVPLPSPSSPPTSTAIAGTSQDKEA